MASVNSVGKDEGASKQSVASEEAKTLIQKNNEDKSPKDNLNGRFSWKEIEGIFIPYTVRKVNGRLYMFVSTWIAEELLLKQYLQNVRADIYTSCTSVKGFVITAQEAKVLNYINNKYYRKDFEFSAGKDYLIRFEELYNFYIFLDVCYKKLLCNDTSGYKDKCGFLCINSESVVPYCTVVGQKYVPIFFFEGETDNLIQSAVKLEGWDLAYLKFCCKLMGVRSHWFDGDSFFVIDLEHIKSLYPPDTEFDDIWSTQKADSYIFDYQSKHENMPRQWFKASLDVGNGIHHNLELSEPEILQSTEVTTNPMLQEEKQEQKKKQEQQQQQINTTTPPVQAHNNSKNAAYKVQMATIEGKAIHCINAKPYMHSDLVVTLKDLVRIMFPSCNVAKCAHVLHKYLKTTLLFGKSEQLACLMENGLIKSMIPGDTPMAMLNDITKVLPKLKLLVLLNDKIIEKII